MNSVNSYLEEAISDAKSTVDNFREDIAEQLADTGKASDDLNNDYPSGDSYHHENHVDKWYSLAESAELLEQLSDYTETDSGLWEGLEPIQAISTQAAFTYGNAVSGNWSELIKAINDRWIEVSGEFDSLIEAGEYLMAELPGLAWPNFDELKKQAIKSIIDEACED